MFGKPSVPKVENTPAIEPQELRDEKKRLAWEQEREKMKAARRVATILAGDKVRDEEDKMAAQSVFGSGTPIRKK